MDYLLRHHALQLSRFFSLQGYRDGLYGLLLSTLLAYYMFVTYRKLWTLQRG